MTKAEIVVVVAVHNMAHHIVVVAIVVETSIIYLMFGLKVKCPLSIFNKNWKVIGYFRDQSATEQAMELSLKKNKLNEVWMVRNFKTVYRSDKDNKEHAREKARVPEENVLMPQTPPNKIYMELVNMASRHKQNSPPPPQTKAREKLEKEKREIETAKKGILVAIKARSSPQKSTKVKEEEVVDIIKEWRIQEKEELEEDKEEEKGFNSLQEEVSTSSLKRDNVSIDKVVTIMKLKNEIKRSEKMTELEEIFEQTDNAMEWEQIQQNAVQRHKDENFQTDEKGLGDKRPISESPKVEISKQKDKTNDKKKKKENKKKEYITNNIYQSKSRDIT
ncbi:hypothetical protein C1646_795107 [Rhizophagus diaphanus]|nr:hypothetical protein C1646_795107 [Rhizophagus diaphanus] [Rhizophagus sp. MUCL 43196]